MIRALLVRLAAAVPSGFRQWLYRHPRLLGPAARLLKSAVPGSGTVTVDIKAGPNKGLRFVVDRRTPNYYWLNDQYEKDVVEALRQNVREGMVVADVGAHLGFDTLMLSRWVGLTGRVLAFEPDPVSFARLRENVEVNRLANVIPHEAAVSDKRGRLRFVAGGEATSHLGDGGEVEVNVVELDSVVFEQAQPRMDLVKIDVENNEVAVLDGARRLTQELRPVFLIEIHSAESLEGCVQRLQRAGYRLTPIPASACFDRMIAGGPADGFRLGHLLAVPEGNRA